MTWTCFDGERKGTRHTHPRAFALMVTSSWMLFPEFSMWLFPSGHSGLSLNMPSLQRLPWLHRHSFLPNFYFLCSILHDLILFYWLICLLDTSVQFSSVAQSCPTLCDPRDWSMQGLPVHHQLPEFTQTHVHWTGDAIQPSHPLSSPPPPASISPSIRVFSSEFFASGGRSISVSASASALPMSIQDWLPLGLTGLIF